MARTKTTFAVRVLSFALFLSQRQVQVMVVSVSFMLPGIRFLESLQDLADGRCRMVKTRDT
jgi:hypothetical protein